MHARFSPFMHYAWLTYGISIISPRVFAVHRCRHVTHRILFAIDGHAELAVTSPHDEQVFSASTGLIAFFPMDATEHVVAVTSATGFTGRVLCLPHRHLLPGQPGVDAG